MKYVKCDSVVSVLQLMEGTGKDWNDAVLNIKSALVIQLDFNKELKKTLPECSEWKQIADVSSFLTHRSKIIVQSFPKGKTNITPEKVNML